MNSKPNMTVVNTIQDVEETQKPFGKRWRQEQITLTPSHLDALRQGKYLALDVQEEYVVFLKLDPTASDDRS